jgi:hypothetical protein
LFFRIFCVTQKYKFFSATTKRWALPVAIILLPGGFAVLAIAWAYKLFGAPGKATPRDATPTHTADAAKMATAGEWWRNYLTAPRQPLLHRPLSRPVTTSPGDEATEKEPAHV